MHMHAMAERLEQEVGLLLLRVNKHGGNDRYVGTGDCSAIGSRLQGYKGDITFVLSGGVGGEFGTCCLWICSRPMG